MIEAGTRLGPYEILAPIGAGGMGEVYKAKDTRLDRTVAIKVLHSHLSDNARLKERFEREARAVSSLNHPHICTLHDIGSENGVDFMVMEHIEGETLADRLKKGALPLDQALRYAIEIADALDKAHRQGVVHRDLKPGNIMLTKSGAKLLDFGLAKLAVGEDAAVESALPTQQRNLTAEGSILGTFQYMAPEQLEGKEADSRTDIFAFGAVLYEMVTGRRAFEGKSQASLIGAIMTLEPPAMSTLQTMTPPLLDHVVRRCLVKEPDGRWQSAADLMSELKWIASGGSAEGRGISGETRPGRERQRGIAGLAVGALIVTVVMWNLRSPVAPAPVTRSAIVVPHRIVNLNRRSVAFSPDGERLAYAANSQIYVRELDRTEAVPIRGTDENASTPFFSPDGEWLGFFAEGALKKVSVQGGAPVTLCEAQSLYGASWGPDGWIVFGQGSGGILRVSDNGGTPEVLVAADAAKGEMATGPQVLPDGDTLLFNLRTAGSWDEAQIIAQSLETGERRVLIEGGAEVSYVPTGHLVYVLGDTLLAVSFDLARLEVSGGSVPVVDGVRRSTASGAAQFTFSENGSLVFLGQSLEELRLVWVDRQGAEEALLAPPDAYGNPRLSPDEQRMAVRIGGDIWIYDIARGTPTRLTFTEDNDTPDWTPDGKRVIFSSARSGPDNLFWMSADGSDAAEQLTTGEFQQHVDSVSPSGMVAFHEHHPATATDIWVLSLESDVEPQPFLQTPFSEAAPAFSPDGRWLAYHSDESGQNEVYVQPFPGPGGKRKISTGGGLHPLWSPNGEEMFYISETTMMAVPVTTDAALTVGTPRPLFDGVPTTGFRPYDVTADGERFITRELLGQTSTELTLVQNWFEELKELVPTD